MQGDVHIKISPKEIDNEDRGSSTTNYRQMEEDQMDEFCKQINRNSSSNEKE